MFKARKRYLILTAILAAGLWFVLGYVVPAFQGQIPIRADYFFGPVRLHMYSLTFFLALLSGYFLVSRRAPKAGLKRERSEDIVLLNVLFGFAGARIFHVFSHWGYYSAWPLEIFQVWRGGLAIFGGIIFGIAATAVYCRLKKINWLSVFDLLSPALAASLAVGRWGNFFNQEAYGAPTTLPWKMFVSAGKRLPEYAQNAFFHPTFLYECLWDIAVFVFLLILSRKNRSPGVVFGWFLVFYSAGRAVLETLRLDAAFFGGWRVNHLWSAGFIILGVILLIRQKTRHKSLA